MKKNPFYYLLQPSLLQLVSAKLLPMSIKAFRQPALLSIKTGNPIEGLAIDSLQFETEVRSVLPTQHPQYRLTLFSK